MLNKLSWEKLKNEVIETVWQQEQKQKGEHKSISFEWLLSCFSILYEIELLSKWCISEHGILVKTSMYIDNIVAIILIFK